MENASTVEKLADELRVARDRASRVELASSELRRFWTIFSMDLANIATSPMLLLYNTVFIVLMLLIMGSLTSGIFASMADTYEYYLVTFAVFGMLEGAMTASNAFLERDIRRPNLRIIHSPTSPVAIPLSKTLAAGTFDLACHAGVCLGFCLLVGTTLGSDPWPFLILMALVEYASAALGTLFCCVFRCEETTSMLLSTVVELLCVAGGTFFPLEAFWPAVAAFSAVTPVSWLNDAFFSMAVDGDASLLAPLAIGTLVVFALLAWGSSRLFKTEDYL
jgi:ABC-2 type transport system permease protein